MEEHKPSGIEWRQRVDRECDNPISPSHVESRRGKGGTFDYVSQYYIIQRMCEIFGGTGWGAKLVSREMVDMREVPSDGGTRWQVVYTATMSVSAAGVSKVGSAAGTGLDRSLPDAIHSAITEAETDALKRACRLFGHSLGLALYDKEKAHVADPDPWRDIRVELTKAGAEGPATFLGGRFETAGQINMWIGDAGAALQKLSERSFKRVTGWLYSEAAECGVSREDIALYAESNADDEAAVQAERASGDYDEALMIVRMYNSAQTVEDAKKASEIKDASWPKLNEQQRAAVNKARQEAVSRLMKGSQQ